MKTILRDSLMVLITVLITGLMMTFMQPPVGTNVSADSKTSSTKAPVQKKTPEAPKLAPVSVPVAKTTIAPPVTAQAPIAPPVQPVPNNETISWNHFIATGYTRNQTAGIMGNLQQEHNFQTSDTPEGIGIAQWTSGRKFNLMSLSNYSDISVQLQFLTDELTITYPVADVAIRAATTVEGSEMAFQSLYERCGNCMTGQRITYAYAILARH